MTISSTDELTPPTEIHHDAPEVSAPDAPEGAMAEGRAPSASAGPEDTAAERRRLEAELAAIEKKREELARALIVNAHPELADPIRVLTGRLYAVSRVEERMREPLSKAEVRKVESLGKKREELARARIVNAHPELADAIRVLRGRLYAGSRVEGRMG